MSTTTSNESIFTGQFYEAWRLQIVSGIYAQQGLDALLSPDLSDTETEFVDLEPHQYAQRHRKHQVKQEKAKSFIYARLSLSIINSVRGAKTVRQLLEKLDEQYRPRTEAAISMAKRRFQAQKFNIGGDMKKWLRIFQDAADQLLDTGFPLTEDDVIQQLIDALPSDYDSVVTNYRIYVRDNNPSLQMLKRYLIDRFERDFEDRKTRPPSRQPRWNEGASSSSASPPETNIQRKETDFICQLKCYRCTGLGHTTADCPSQLKSLNGSSHTGGTYEEKKAKAHMMMVRSVPWDPVPVWKTPLTQSESAFLLDTGTDTHVTSKLCYLSNVQKLDPPLQHRCALKGISLSVTHIGEMLIETTNREGVVHTILLQNVSYAPELEMDLLSENQITETGRYEIHFSREYADVYDTNSGEITLSAVRRDNAKFVYFKPLLRATTPMKTPPDPLSITEKSPATLHLGNGSIPSSSPSIRSPQRLSAIGYPCQIKPQLVKQKTFPRRRHTRLTSPGSGNGKPYPSPAPSSVRKKEKTVASLNTTAIAAYDDHRTNQPPAVSPSSHRNLLKITVRRNHTNRMHIPTATVYYSDSRSRTRYRGVLGM